MRVLVSMLRIILHYRTKFLRCYRKAYTEIVFALFDLLGMQFAPRLRDIGDQQLYRMSREQKARHLAPRLKGIIKQDLIVRHWDDFLWLAGSLKLGWVTASLFISKLQA